MRKHGFDLEEGTWRVAETSMGERDPLNDAVVGAVSSPRLAGPALMPRSARHCHVVTCLLEAHIGFQHTHFRPKLSATEALSMKPANLSTPPPPGELDRRSRLMSSGRSAGVCRVAAAAERASAGRPPEKVAAEAAAAEAAGGRGSVGGRASSSVAGTGRGRRRFPRRPRLLPPRRRARRRRPRVPLRRGGQVAADAAYARACARRSDGELGASDWRQRFARRRLPRRQRGSRSTSELLSAGTLARTVEAARALDAGSGLLARVRVRTQRPRWR